jgi:hypothetical protein
MPAPLPVQVKPVVQPVTPSGPPTAAKVIMQRLVAEKAPVQLVRGKPGQPTSDLVVVFSLGWANE